MQASPASASSVLCKMYEAEIFQSKMVHVYGMTCGIKRHEKHHPERLVSA